MYCRQKASCDEVAAALREAGVSAVAYYSTMAEKAKAAALNGWVGGAVRIRMMLRSI